MSFSVLMSVYSRENPLYLRESLLSLSSQTLLAGEVILVEDGPISLELADVIESFRDELNIVSVKLASNCGLSTALNSGLNACKYELVARMDTDDKCLPERFQLQYNYLLENSDIDICGSYSLDINEDDVVLSLRQVPESNDLIRKLIWSCPIIHPSVMFRKSSILSIGSYSVTAPHRQDDYELWIRAAFSGLVFFNIPKPLILYRVPSNAFQKNTVSVGMNRIKVGFRAVKHFDNRLFAYCGLFYPMFRAMLPVMFQKKLQALITAIDPRRAP